jgi:hypothetical protein
MSKRRARSAFKVGEQVTAPKPGRVGEVVALRGDKVVVSTYGVEYVYPAHKLRRYRPGRLRPRPFPMGSRPVYSDRKPGVNPWI